MLVRATEPGFDNVCFRQEGDEFEVADDFFQKSRGPHWFEPVDEKQRAKLEKQAATESKVPAVNPAKQAKGHEASVKALASNPETLKV
jgi:hypothetical protein